MPWKAHITLGLACGAVFFLLALKLMIKNSMYFIIELLTINSVKRKITLNKFFTKCFEEDFIGLAGHVVYRRTF
jgi:oligoribonuclease NrnB/cAMP/cGMP phosphodiesterase (DHH superfamily)